MNQKRKYTEEGMNGSSGNEFGKEFDELLKSLKVPTGKPKEQVWQTILENIEHQKEAKVISITSIALRIAASLLLLGSIGGSIWIWGFGKVAVYAPKGQHISHILPDSSQIQLNADTRISYNKVLWNLSRKVKLNGEALFKVKKGEQFDVVTELTTTSVLGTTFDVYARNGKVKVSCIEGKVQVKTHKTESKVILTAGLFTQIHEQKLSIPVEKTIKEEVAWSDGEFFFINTPFNDVLKEIERQFNVEVEYIGEKGRFYSGYFNNKDLNDALRLVCIPMEMSYSVNGKTIEIKQIESK
ncbi:MAG: FecR family protein [Tenuifilaceae bacterium]